MKFITAKRKLAEIAAGRYYALQYKLGCYNERKGTPECSVYIDGGPWLTRGTWAEALAVIHKPLQGSPPMNPEEMPGEEPAKEGK